MYMFHIKFLKKSLFENSNVPTFFQEVDENTTKPVEGKCSHQDGTSWAVELGSEQNFCPIVVKDLDQPRHMLIEVCLRYNFAMLLF